MQDKIVWIFLGIIAFFALIGAFKGARRGISRQIIRTLTVVGSAALAIWISKIPYNKYVLPFFDGKTTEQLVSDIQGLGVLPVETDLSILYNFDPETIKYLITLPIALIVIPLIFVILFMLISFLSLIIHACISGLLGFRKKNNNFITRLLGLVLGAVQGVAVAALLLTPVIGYAQVYSDTVTALNEEMPDNATAIKLSDTYNAYVKDTLEHPVTQTAKKFGVDVLFGYLVTVNTEESVSVTMTDKVPTAASIYADAMKLGGADWKALTPEQEAAIKSIIDKIDRDEYFAVLLSGAVRGASYCYTNGAFQLEIGEPFGSLINSAVSIFHTSDRDNFADDLNTLVDVYFVLSRDGVLSALGEDTDKLLDIISTRNPETNSTPIKDVINTINSNPRIKPLVGMLAKISVTAMSESMNLGEDGGELYENVSQGLENVLQISKENKTKDEYIAEVSQSINATLTENNIELEPEIVDKMAEYIHDQNLAEQEGVTSEDILITYFDAYLEYKETGSVPDDFVPPDDFNPDDLPDDFNPDDLPGLDLPGDNFVE